MSSSTHERELPHPIVLASGSPRRRDLLSAHGIEFEIRPSNIPEDLRDGEQPAAFAERLAREKALAVAGALPEDDGRWVLGADTIVVVDTDVLGKPDDPEHSARLLARLVGRAHKVITGVAVVRADTLETRSTTVTSGVVMRDADEAEIRAYVATGEPLDKAGGYALQGEGARFVTRVDGSRSNVIGLPMDETLELLGRPPRSATADAS